MDIHAKLPRGVEEGPYGQGKRYIFPHSLLVRAEPIAGKPDLLSIQITCRVRSDFDFIGLKLFREYEKDRDTLRVPVAKLSNLLTQVFREDFDSNHRN